MQKAENPMQRRSPLPKLHIEQRSRDSAKSKLEALTRARREIVQALRTNTPTSAHPPGPTTNLSEANEPLPFPSAATGTRSLTGNNATCDFVISRLQPNQSLGFLLKYCFDELEIYYPCIDRADFYQRLSLLFDRYCAYHGRTTWIPKRPEYLSLAALTCTILALATYLGGRSASGELHEEDCAITAAEWHLESRKLLEEYAWSDEPCLDVLRVHILEVLYHTMLEKSQAMSMAKAVAVELAFALDLHNEASWAQLTYRQREYRRMLWWMVYIIDRRVSIRTGRPYLINDTDFVVEDFSSESLRCYLLHPVFDLGHIELDGASGVYQWPRPSEPTEDWFAYLQFNTRWSRIATRVWDNCCSLGTARAVDVEEIGALDALLVSLESSLAPTLLWKHMSLLDLTRAGKTDRYIRLRLIIFEVYFRGDSTLPAQKY
ncbi:hypothetical protein CLCR_00853 [Cladophialophora carrionii]|uniref:Xylanolytic transcriptional activator regulatory domain-containing protein n=1 Tax=Cladophialophora carrionii TaxID=86049 RepID=A0A1C1D1C6_9EURO|nr:hypothetical protein CLCR_00853 [Cladophialophora carrionii]